MKLDISKNRYLELKYFCMQYKEFKEEQRRLLCSNDILKDQDEFADPTGEIAARIADLSNCIKMIEEAASNCDSEIGDYILYAVTNNAPFTNLKMRCGLPCERDMFYDRRRKFFFLLDKIR